MKTSLGLVGILAFVAFVIANVAALFTHMFYSFFALIEPGADNVLQALGVLIVGTVIPFLGAIHGWMIWFGAGLF